MIGKSSEAGSRSSEQLSPAYPADHDNLPHKVNPDVTEDTLDPKLVKDSREYKFPTSPKIGSVKEESIDTSGDKMVSYLLQNIYYFYILVFSGWKFCCGKRYTKTGAVCFSSRH